jgi:hypothetical protein
VILDKPTLEGPELPMRRWSFNGIKQSVNGDAAAGDQGWMGPSGFSKSSVNDGEIQ